MHWIFAMPPVRRCNSQYGTVVGNTVRSSFVVTENRKEWEIALRHFSDVPASDADEGRRSRVWRRSAFP
ncbi:hypothetical protein AZF01_18060 [Martelella sp. AD-3]|nr:hypothetical protein AZF01_18060 [Martelella sp. AD-3]MAM11470.1 hypothetical protein [Rhizobiaceae bacterium]